MIVNLYFLQKEKVHNEYILASTKDMNVHVMNKFSLERLLNVQRIFVSSNG